jgi:hypothetical protein
MKYLHLFVLFFAFICVNSAKSQLTYPTPFDLSTGNYAFTEWSSTNPAGTYPTSMIFHRSSTQDPLLSTEMTTNYTLAYNLTSGSRINGLGTNGVSFVNTGTNGNLGAAVLALNTINRTNIQVTWTGGFVKIAGTTSREYRIILQYKIGDSGNFQNVTDQNGNPVEYVYNEYVNHPNPTILPPNSRTFTVTLPPEVEDQPVVYLRWKYYFLGSGSGNRPELRIDDIYVQSESSVGGGTKLLISNVTPSTPLTNVPFSLTVFSVDDNDVPKKVSQATTIRISLISGSGTLLGTLTKAIPYKSTNVIFDDLTYNIVQTIRIKAEVLSGDALNPAEKEISFVQGPAGIVIENLYGKGHVGSVHPTFNIRAVNTDGSTNTNYHNYPVQINFQGPQNFTSTGTFTNGVATISGVIFPASGNYTTSASSPGFPSSNTGQVDVKPAPTFTEIMVPKYIKGVGNFGTRIPSFALVRLENLHPNTTYRYFTGGRNVGYTGDVSADNGAGNNIHYNHLTNTYLYNSIRDLAQQNGYSSFQSNSDGTQYVWLSLVPTTNTSFNEGRNVYWILVLGTERGSLIKRYQTTNTSLAADFGNPPTKVTGIYDENSWLPPKSFVCLYDDTNATNPITIAIVQNEGTVLQDGIDPNGNPYPPQGPEFYNNLDGVDGAWATIIPNNLSGGIKKLQVYNRDGSIYRTIFDLDGVWAGTQTANIYGGMDSPIEFKTPNLKITTPAVGSTDDICNNGSYKFRWISRGVDKIDIEVSQDRGNSYFNIFEGIPASKGEIDWNIPRGFFADTTNRIRIVDREHPVQLQPQRQYLASESGDFYIFDKPIVTYHTPSAIACKGEDVILDAFATGSKIGYQWYKDGKKIEGATSQRLILNNVNYTTSGVYRCEATGASVCESDFTNSILVYVLTSTSISKEPKDYYGYMYTTATFNFDAHLNGAPPEYNVSIQWYKNGVPLRDDWKYSGTRSNYFTVKNVTYDDTSDYFFAVVNGKCGMDTTARVRIHIVPFILIKPDTMYICDNDRYLQIPIEIPSVVKPFKYIIDIYRDGTFIGTYPPSIAGNVITLPNVSLLPGDYWGFVRIPELGISLKTNILKVIKISDPPKITKDLPASINLKVGDDLDLSIEAEGLNLHYQWYKDSNPLSGAIEPKLFISNVTTEDAGNYYCKVWNCDTVSSTITNVSITLFAISGVIEETTYSANVFPNPTSGSASLLLEPKNPLEFRVELVNSMGVKIADLAGRNVFEKAGKIEIPFAEYKLPAGTYFVRIVANNKEKVIPITYIP